MTKRDPNGRNIAGLFPIEWVNKVSNYCKKYAKKDNGGIIKFKQKVLIYHAIEEFMQNHPVE